MVLKRVGILSCGKVCGLLYAAIGLIIGVFVSMFSMLGAFASLASRGGGSAVVGLMFGAGAIIILPIFYGFLGFIGGIICSALYNGVAHIAGGLEVELE
jgi:hypothetical protein